MVSAELNRLGAIVDEAIAYRTVPATDDGKEGGRSMALERFRREGADWITFASSSSVENFLAMKIPLPAGIRVASLGPITSRTLRDAKIKVDVESPNADLDTFAQAIAAARRS